MKFKNKKTGVIVDAKNMFEENILKSNSNYIEVKQDAKSKENASKKTQDAEMHIEKGGE